MTQKIHFLKTEISILVISNHNSFRVLFGKNCFRIFSLKSVYILALEMASPGNQHCHMYRHTFVPYNASG